MTTVATDTQKWVPELTFGARLALVRHRMGWNVKEAAAACGLPAQSWRGWEIAGHLPRRYVAIAKQIAGVTGCDYLWLVHGPDRGEGGLTNQLRPVTERLIERPRPAKTQPKVRGAGRPARTTSPVRPTQRRAKPLRSPNRAELAAA